MSRTLTSKTVNDFSINVKSWYILKNGWEYFVTKSPDEDGIGEALVQGFETEIGSFSLEEIKPYIISSANESELHDLAPPDGWVWS